MKNRMRIVSIILVFSLLFAAPLPVKASEYVYGVHESLKNAFEFFPEASVNDATVINGGYKDLSFFSDTQPPQANTDIYCIAIYRGSTEKIIQQAEQGKDPELIDTFAVSGAEFTKNYNTTIRWKADSRYPVGDYALACFLLDGTTGNIYNRFPVYWTDLHVVDRSRSAGDFSMWVFYSDGWHEICENDVVYLSYPTNYLLFSPEPVPCTEQLNYSLSCTLPNKVKFGKYRNYITIEPSVGNIMTKVTVTAGKLKHTFWLQSEGNDERNTLKLTCDKSVLCVGDDDRCVVKQKDGTISQYTVAPDWSSSDPSIATVSSSGHVRALKPGKVTITAVAGRFKQSVTYTVNYHKLPEGTSVTGPTATQPKQAVGHCSVCGKDDAVNIYEPAIFTDTKASAWYAKHVDKVYDLGLMNGVGEHTFAPNANVTRAMAATVLYRIAGKPKVEGASTFTDVAPGKYYSKAVVWAQETGVVNGYPDGTFRPDENITREQLAAILCRYAAVCGIGTSAGADLLAFPDGNEVHNYAKKALAWAVGEKLITGVGVDGKTFLQPTSNATRAQFATIISRYLSTIQPAPEEPDPETQDPENPDPDNPIPVDPDPTLVPSR